MAIDQTTKALNLASKLVTESSNLMSALERLNALLDEKESSGVDFTSAAVEAALASSGNLKHVDGTTINAALSSITTVTSWLKTNFHDDNFQKLRP